MDNKVKYNFGTLNCEICDVPNRKTEETENPETSDTQRLRLNVYNITLKFFY